MAYSYFQNGEINLSIETYNAVIEKFPDYSWAYYNLGAIYFLLENNDSAIEYLNKTVKINPKDMKAYKILAQIYIKQKIFDKAQMAISKALQINNFDGDLYYYLSRCYKDKDNEKYVLNLKQALKNYQNLSYNIDLIKKELKTVQD